MSLALVRDWGRACPDEELDHAIEELRRIRLEREIGRWLPGDYFLHRGRQVFLEGPAWEPYAKIRYIDNRLPGRYSWGLAMPEDLERFFLLHPHQPLDMH